MKPLHHIGELIRTNLVRNAGKLLSANILAQAIGLLFYPILTRIYSPADFGLFNLFISIGAILSLFGTAEYHYAIALPKETDKAVACFQGGFIGLLTFSLFCGISSLFSNTIAQWFNTPELAEVYPLMGLFVLFTGLWNLLNYWFIRNNLFGRIGIYQIFLIGGNSVSKYTFGVLRFLQGGLIFGTIAGQLIATIGCLVGKSRTLLSPLFRPQRSLIGSMLRQYRNYPLYSLPRVLINNLSSNLPVLVLTPVFGTAELGLFGMAITLAFRPINMIVSSLYQVFLQQSGDQLHRQQPIAPMLRRYVQHALLITLPIFTLLYTVLPSLTAWLLGEEWRTTGEYIRLMLPWLLLTLVLSPMGHLTDLFMKQNWWLGFEIISFVLRISGLLLGMWQDSIMAAIAYYCLAGAISYLLQIPCFVYLISHYERQH